MAKSRYISTNFWMDDFVNSCDPTEKLLFLYLITNPATTICGIYQLPLSTMAAQTGIDKEMIQKIFKRFEEEKKACYLNGWVIITNFPRYQKYEQRPKIRAGIEASLAEVPQSIKSAIDTLSIPYAYDMDKISIPYAYEPNYSELDSDSEREREGENTENTPPPVRKFQRPSIEDVQAYIDELGITSFTGSQFTAFYDSVGWVIGKGRTPMKDWRAAVRTWRARDGTGGRKVETDDDKARRLYGN